MAFLLLLCLSLFHLHHHHCSLKLRFVSMNASLIVISISIVSLYKIFTNASPFFLSTNLKSLSNMSHCSQHKEREDRFPIEQNELICESRELSHIDSNDWFQLKSCWSFDKNLSTRRWNEKTKKKTSSPYQFKKKLSFFSTKSSRRIGGKNGKKRNAKESISRWMKNNENCSYFFFAGISAIKSS